MGELSNNDDALLHVVHVTDEPFSSTRLTAHSSQLMHSAALRWNKDHGKKLTKRPEIHS